MENTDVWCGAGGRARAAGVLATWLILLASPGYVSGQQTPVNGLTTSPLLIEWSSRLEREGDEAQDAFWELVRARGTPVVEADSAHPGHSIVTFLVRGATDGQRVRLESNLTALLQDESFLPPDSMGWMDRLEGSDVWYRSFRLRNDVRAPYRIAIHGADRERVVDVDPLNADVWEPDVGGLRASILELPGAPPQPWRNPSGEEGAGDWDELTSEEDGRSVYVYKPVAWEAENDGDYPVLVGLGAFGHGIGMRVDRMVDTLIAVGRLPPLVVALVDLTRDDEGSRYESVGGFVVEELLPHLRASYGVTEDPRRVVVSGTSRRGMIAALLALRHPEEFGNVLSLSGSYYWRPEGEEFEWVPRRYAEESRRPVRFYLAAGELETFVSPGNRGHYLLSTNRHMHDVLVARGYAVEYVEFNGVHSELNWQDWLADGLIRLLGE